MTAQLSPTPVQKFFNNNGLPLFLGTLSTYVAGTTTPQATYIDSTQTTPNTNPIQLNYRGECNLWLDPTLIYKFILKDVLGNTIWTVDNIPGGFGAAPLSINLIPNPTNTYTLGNSTHSWAQLYLGPNADPAYNAVSDTIGYIGRTAAEIAAGVTPVNFAYPPMPVADARRYCTLVLDSSTDNTAAISGMWTALTNYRGTITIPYGAKFNKSTVYSTQPVGVILIDESSVNTGQPPGYKNKHIDQVTNNTVSDDSFQGIIDGHNPAFRLNNTRTSGSASALGCFHNILFATGFRWNNDPVDGMQYLTSLSTRVAPPAYLWRNSWVTNTKAQAAILSVQWFAATVFGTGALINTTDGNVWINNGASGTTASTQPTGTGPTFSDGTVTWTWLFAWNVASTLFFFDEDGYGGITGATARWGADGQARKGPSLNVNDSTHDAFLRDDQRAQDFWRISDASGLQNGGILSLNYSGALSGATPTLSGSMHTVTNGGATNMTNLVLPGTQTRGYVVLYFTNGNTTVKATGFNLKGGVDVTPVAGNIITLFKEPGISGSWTEISRNF